MTTRRKPSQGDKRKIIHTIAAEFGLIGLTVGDLRTMVALLMFTNLRTKQCCLDAMKRMETP